MRSYLTFNGVGVHPMRVEKDRATEVGVWIPDITPDQREAIMQVNEECRSGHFGVRTGVQGTAVIYIGPIKSQMEARKITIFMIKLVAFVTKTHSVLRELPNYRSVSRALAV